jgi:S-formylglutathione hydrolase FrmB
MWLAVACNTDAGGGKLEFQLRFDAAVSQKPYSGRVYVLLSKSPVKDLPAGPRWFNTEPFFALDVQDWQPGQVRTITGQTPGFPHTLDRLEKGEYWAFAVMDINGQERSFVQADGNGYSKPVAVELDVEKTGPVSFLINQVYRNKPFAETKWVKEAVVESQLLSKFHQRPVLMKAGVVLPKSYYDQPEKRYPVLYIIPGFGGTHDGAHTVAGRNGTLIAGTEVICVVLNPGCRWGHHVFADSDNNGPWGKALCEELIPHVEKTYRGQGTPASRLLTGHSSGGWSSLWLQVAYPDFFGGVWSTAPDPVDFRDFQRVNIYEAGISLFRNPAGEPRPLARKKDKVLFTYQTFSDMEGVMGHGGQLQLFEAVFGPKNADGKPRTLWNRQTGAVDAETAAAWKRYDIRLILEQNWPTLAPKLRGKIHVYMGDDDNFYLDGATRLLRDALAKLQSDAVIELFPDRDHGTLMTQELRERIAKEMAEKLGGRTKTTAGSD